MKSIFAKLFLCTLIGSLSPSLSAGYYQTILRGVSADVKARLDIDEEWSLSQPGSGMDWFSGKAPSDRKYSQREIEQTLAVLLGASHVHNARKAIETFILSWDPAYKFTIEDLAKLGGITVKTHQAFRTVDNYWYSNFYQGDVLEKVCVANSNFASLNTFLSWWHGFRPGEMVSLSDLKSLVSSKLLRHESTAHIQEFFTTWNDVVGEPLSLADYLNMVGHSNKSGSYGSSHSQMEGATQFVEAFGTTVRKEHIRRISEHYAITFSNITALLADSDERDLEKLIDIAEKNDTSKKRKKRRKDKLHDFVDTAKEVPGFLLGALSGMDVTPSHNRTVFFFLPSGH